MSFFEVYNSYYLNGFFDRPFNLFTGLILLFMGPGVLIFSKDKAKKTRLAFLYTFVLSFYILFTYVADYPQSFRYISHLAPVSMLLIVAVYSSLFLIYSKPWQIGILAALIVGNLASHFYKRYPDLYIDNPIYNAQPSVAFQTIENNYKKGEALFLQFATPYYLKDLDTSAVVVDMSRDKKYSYSTFLEDINKYKAGWVSWSTFNQYHIDDDIVQYCNLYFTKYHGYGIDETNKEVFYFLEEDIASDNAYRFDSSFPEANLNLSNPYTSTFWFRLKQDTKNFPVTVSNKTRNIIGFYRYNDEYFYMKYNEKDSAKFSVPVDNKFHFFTWEQTGNQTGDSVKLLIDNQLASAMVLTASEDTIVKFNVNRKFNGQVDDIRIYGFLLNEKQKNVLADRNLSLKQRALKVKGKSFSPLFYWTKK
ncbi:MAG: LamG domain-containing protein [Chloroflexia bacterium]|nr:LamG domain-containing protein [Chloroflexia bacterium]